MATIERWKPVAGFEDAYQVSDLGRVLSVPRTVLRSNGTTYRVAGRILKLRPTDHGHPMVLLHGENGVERQVYVHRLVLETFRGPPADGMEACHFNDDPADNRLENLRWDTHSSNQFDKVRNGHDHNARKTHCKYGHEFTPENTLVNKNGHRNCRECSRRVNREAQRMRRGTRPPGACGQCGRPRESGLYKLCERCRAYYRRRGTPAS